MLEPLLQGFNEPEGTDESILGIKNANADKLDENPAGRTSSEVVSSPSQEPLQRENRDGMQTARDGDGDVPEGSSAISDDIAALEAELQEEGDDKGDGGPGMLSKHPLCGEEEAVRRAAWCLFEVLLPRCVGLEGQGLEARLEEPTSFSHRQARILRGTICWLLVLLIVGTVVVLVSIDQCTLFCERSRYGRSIVL